MPSTTGEKTVYSGETDEIENVGLVRLRLITHNARLVDARKERGMTQLVMAQTAGIALGQLRDIENLRVVPTEEEIIKIACILGKPMDYLLPEQLISAVKAGVFSKRRKELDVPEVISLTEAQNLRLLTDWDVVEREADRKLLGESINDILSTLQPREQRVLRLRFGFEGNPMLLEEIGKEFNVTRSRVSQIERKALRKLRSMSQARNLKDYLE